MIYTILEHIIKKMTEIMIRTRCKFNVEDVISILMNEIMKHFLSGLLYF